MSLQGFLVEKFKNWRPHEPEVVKQTKYSITLSWLRNEPFGFLADQLLYRIEKNNKLPQWIVVYRGGKIIKEIDNLAPSHPHKFRLKVMLKATALLTLADKAIQHFGDEKTIYEKMEEIKMVLEKDSKKDSGIKPPIIVINGSGDKSTENHQPVDDEEQGTCATDNNELRPVISTPEHPWLESRWSDETWTNTDSEGTSIVCFCMAVRCGYIKQVQGMLDERPELIGIINTSNGITPLATAVRKGDLNTVRFLLTAGADINQPCSTGQTALHLAVLAANINITDFLLEKGASFLARDLNGLHVEHYAVDSCNLDMLKYIFNKGGDVNVEDNNGWTPLFRALCQGANTEIVEELVIRGSDVDAKDKAGLPLTSVARLLKNRHGRNRDSILRLVDCNYPHEKALANFTRLTKKIYNVHTLLKLPGLNSKANLRN